MIPYFFIDGEEGGETYTLPCLRESAKEKKKGTPFGKERGRGNSKLSFFRSKRGERKGICKSKNVTSRKEKGSDSKEGGRDHWPHHWGKKEKRKRGGE